MRYRTLVFGVDGATFEVIDPLVAAGKMPALAGLMARGVRAGLRSTCPPVSAPAWTTFLTGKQPGKHGVFCFQNFDAELASLPGEYEPPAGHLLLAFVDGELAGCGAMRPLADADYANACEMKRLYVRPGYRRFGLGRAMAEALLDEARGAGYSAMLLDTLDDMETARELYASLGFQEIPPYYFNPIPGAHYLKVDLT